MYRILKYETARASGSAERNFSRNILRKIHMYSNRDLEPGLLHTRSRCHPSNHGYESISLFLWTNFLLRFCLRFWNMQENSAKDGELE
jgi:hypothetical protein